MKLLHTKPGLRTEIVVHIVLLVAAALLFVSFVLLKLTEREVLTERVTGAVRLIDALAHQLKWDYRAIQLPEINSAMLVAVDANLNVMPLLEEEVVHGIHLEELRRVKLLRESRFLLQYDTSWWPFGEGRERFAVVSAPVLMEGRFVGAVQGTFPLEDIRQSLLGWQRFVLALTFVYGFILTVCGIYLLSRNVVKPVRILARATRQVRAGRFEGTIDVQGPAEIAALANDFNDMVGALRESRQVTEATIASLQKANEEIRRTQQELIRSERLASVGHLAAGMAHEIGNPLGAVVGYLELLKGDVADPSSRDLAQRSLAELERIDRLLRDLLDYATPSSDQRQRFDPVPVVSEALALLAQQGVLEGARVQNRLPCSLANVFASRHKLLQVFVNLLLNARDASSGDAQICLDGRVEGGEVCLCVSDEGCGMSAEQQVDIFDPFYTTKDPGKGRGLGLAVCHRIVEEAGGRIKVTSQVGAGSTFMVCLPIDSGEKA